MFSAMATAHINEPRNVGPLEGATHYGVAGEPGEGPFVQLWFDVADQVIKRGAYKTYGCPTSIASSSIVAEILQGKSVDVALSIAEEDVIALIGYVPEGKGDCPKRVVDALKNAFAQDN